MRYKHRTSKEITSPSVTHSNQPSSVPVSIKPADKISIESEAFKRFPFINHGNRNSNIDAIIDVKKRTVDLEIKGLSPSEAYSRALQEIGIKYSAPGIKRS